MSHRIQQVNELLLREIGSIISKEVDLRSDALLTIKKVEAADDLEYAKVWVSVFPESREEEVMNILQKNIGRVQYALNRRVVMKFVPKIDFRLDQSEQKAAHIRKLIDQTKKS